MAHDTKGRPDKGFGRPIHELWTGTVKGKDNCGQGQIKAGH